MFLKGKYEKMFEYKVVIKYFGKRQYDIDSIVLCSVCEVI